MNDVTKQFFVKIYLQQVTNGDYVDWAIACLTEGFDSKGLRLLAGLEKNHKIKADFEDLFGQSLIELDWNYLSKKVSLLNYSKDIAEKILSGEIEPVEGSKKINEIYVRLHFPPELENWSYLDEGHSTDWFDRVWWFPLAQKYNHKKWLEAVKTEAKQLVETKFS